MKKWFAIFLAAAMVFGLAACTSSENAPEAEPEVVRSDVPAEDQIDVIVANILADIIILLLPDVPGKLKEGGLFFASGIIENYQRRASGGRRTRSSR